jgi:hypothetical protein
MYCIQHCFICRPSDSTASDDAEIEPRPVATTALTVRLSYHVQNLTELLRALKIGEGGYKARG